MAILTAVSSIFGQTTDAEPDKLGVFINRRPLADFSERARGDIEAGRVDLITNFKVVISGTLGEGSNKGTIVLKDPKSVTAIGDADSVKSAATLKLVQDAILAIGDSGWYGHLYQLNVRNVTISIEQTDQTFAANVRSTHLDANAARATASGLNAMFSLVKNWIDGDEKLILSQMNTTAEDRDSILEFVMPKDDFHRLLQRQIAGSVK